MMFLQIAFHAFYPELFINTKNLNLQLSFFLRRFFSRPSETKNPHFPDPEGRRIFSFLSAHCIEKASPSPPFRAGESDGGAKQMVIGTIILDLWIKQVIFSYFCCLSNETHDQTGC
jgi:hypothetical protein